MYLKFAFLVLATSLFSIVGTMPLRNSNLQEAGNNHGDTPKSPQPPRMAQVKGDPPLKITFRQTNANLPILPPNSDYNPREIVESYLERIYNGVSHPRRRFHFVNEYQVLDPDLIWFRVDDDIVGNPCNRVCIVTANWKHVQADRVPAGALGHLYQAGDSQYPDYQA
ncbi:hypothetical protein GGU10DRAFT_103911 [Lentinula aff. detonsa]|uniref:Uncharacterized protein n=1 Tax=Lentinula aff. detonsa TaxID=2804958 RepID=A0AA38NTS2_9AGAR|nr:hypothetical protein GGU10DRAFT_103911 [Lentinula aff. detonsa]